MTSVGAGERRLIQIKSVTPATCPPKLRRSEGGKPGPTRSASGRSIGRCLQSFPNPSLRAKRSNPEPHTHVPAAPGLLRRSAPRNDVERKTPDANSLCVSAPLRAFSFSHAEPQRSQSG